MPVLKLPRLPDRTPVKITISLSPDVHRSLSEYSEVYRQTYGESEAEPIAEMIPYMLQNFLEGDRMFAKARRRRAEPAIATPTPAKSVAKA